MNRIIASLQVVVMLTYLVACNNSNLTFNQTPTIPLTSITIPTTTNEPTAILTPVHTRTPLPLATLTCPPQPNSQVTLNSMQGTTSILDPGAKVIWYDNFNCQDLSYGWGVGGFTNPTANVSVSNGIVTFSAQKVEKIWESIGRPYSLGDQKGFLVLFRYQAKTTANLFFSTGTWKTPDYRRWGLTIASEPGGGSWVGWHGSEHLSSYFPSQLLQPNVWYYLLERLEKSGQVTMKVWEKDDPANHADFQMDMPSNWIGRDWAFLVQVNEGTLEMDEYQEISFEVP